MKLVLNRNYSTKFDDFLLIDDNDILRLCGLALLEMETKLTSEELARHYVGWRDGTLDLEVDSDYILVETEYDNLKIMDWDTASQASEESYQSMAEDYWRELEAWKCKGNLCSLPPTYVIFDFEGFVRDCLIEDHFGGVTQGETSGELFPKDRDGNLVGSCIVWRAES